MDIMKIKQFMSVPMAIWATRLVTYSHEIYLLDT